MVELEQGQVEVVVSQSEQIGLPNWSHVDLFAALKGRVDDLAEEHAQEHLGAILASFIRSRVISTTRSLSMWAGVEPPDEETPREPENRPDFIGPIAVTFSASERIAFPDRSQINLFASGKRLVRPDAIIEGLMEASGRVGSQLSQKRAIVVEKPRPWTTQK